MRRHFGSFYFVYLLVGLGGVSQSCALPTDEDLAGDKQAAGSPSFYSWITGKIPGVASTAAGTTGPALTTIMTIFRDAAVPYTDPKNTANRIAVAEYTNDPFANAEKDIRKLDNLKDFCNRCWRSVDGLDNWAKAQIEVFSRTADIATKNVNIIHQVQKDNGIDLPMPYLDNACTTTTAENAWIKVSIQAPVSAMATQRLATQWICQYAHLCSSCEATVRKIDGLRIFAEKAKAAGRDENYLRNAFATTETNMSCEKLGPWLASIKSGFPNNATAYQHLLTKCAVDKSISDNSYCVVSRKNSCESTGGSVSSVKKVEWSKVPYPIESEVGS